MNRLAELNGGGGGGATAVHIDPNAGGATVGNDSVYSNAAESDGILEAFYRRVANVQTHLREVQNGMGELNMKHGERIRTPDTELASKLSEQLNDLQTAIGEHFQKGEAELKAMADGTAQLKKTPEDEANNAAVIKIQQNQHAHLLRNYMSMLKDYQAMQAEFKQQRFEQTKRQIETKYRDSKGNEIGEEQAEALAREVLELGTTNAIFQQSKDTLAQIIETRNDIIKIEQSMRELNQLFSDLAALVNEQGELMDQILANVETSVQYVEKGREELGKAKKYAKKSRKKMCYIIVFVFILLLFILAPTLGATIPKP